MFTITKRWLEDNKTKNGGYTKRQMDIIGFTHPPPKGWMKECCGQLIQNDDAFCFELAKDEAKRDRYILLLSKVKQLPYREKIAIYEYLLKTIGPN